VEDVRASPAEPRLTEAWWEGTWPRRNQEPACHSVLPRREKKFTRPAYTNTIDVIGAGKLVSLNIAFALSTTVVSQGGFTGVASGEAAVVPLSPTAYMPAGTTRASTG